jgi:hypothetical protein
MASTQGIEANDITAWQDAGLISEAKGAAPVESSSPARVLIVAHKTAATPALLEAVRERAARGPAKFTLLVPNPAHGLHRVVDPEDQAPSEAEQVLELALPLLEEAAGAPVEGKIGVASPLDAVQDDEVIVSTLPARVSRWLHLDLPRKIAGCGVPVTTVTAKGTKQPAGTA